MLLACNSIFDSKYAVLGAPSAYQLQCNKLGRNADVQKQHDGAEAFVASQGKELAAMERELQALKEELNAREASHAEELKRQAQVCSTLGWCWATGTVTWPHLAVRCTALLGYLLRCFAKSAAPLLSLKDGALNS